MRPRPWRQRRRKPSPERQARFQAENAARFERIMFALYEARGRTRPPEYRYPPWVTAPPVNTAS
jgi:hypothetical protein